MVFGYYCFLIYFFNRLIVRLERYRLNVLLSLGVFFRKKYESLTFHACLSLTAVKRDENIAQQINTCTKKIAIVRFQSKK